MNVDWIEILLELGIFLISSYFLFYKSFIKAVGEQQAKIVTIEELTALEENVRQGFKKELEEYRSELSKNNIAFQISLAEVTKQRLFRIEQLIESLVRLQFYVKKQIYTATSKEDYQGYSEYYQPAEISSKLCALYLDDDLNGKISTVIETTHEALAYFIDIHEHLTEPKKQQVDYSESKKRLTLALNKFPYLLKTLTNEFQKQIILKDLSE